MNSEILQEVNWHIQNKLGTNLYANSLVKDKDLYRFNINVSNLIIHKDSFSKERTVSYLLFKDLLNGTISKKNRTIRTPKIKELDEKINLQYRALNRESEKIIMKASSDKISKLQGVDYVLKPVSNILYSLHIDNIIEKKKLTKKMEHYVKLLLDMKVIRELDDCYKFTNQYLKAKNNLEFEDFKPKVYSVLLSDGYDTLRNFFGFKSIDTYLKIENSYYSDSIESNKLLKRSRNEMYKNYLNRYSPKPEVKYKEDLYSLTKVGCFKEQNSEIIGDVDIFNTVSSLREQQIDFAKINY